MGENLKSLKIFRKEISQCRKKLNEGTVWDFSTSILNRNIKKMQRRPFREKKFSKRITMPKKKTGTGDPLVSPGIVWCAKKRNNSFD